MYQFHVPKMSCGGCLNNITKAIKTVDQDAKVAADIPTKIVHVETVASQAQVIKAMTDAGYQPAL